VGNESFTRFFTHFDHGLLRTIMDYYGQVWTGGALGFEGLWMNMDYYGLKCGLSIISSTAFVTPCLTNTFS
jgi:hypothetical protein